MSLDPVVSWTLQAGLALLLGGSALSKLRDPAAFAGAVAGYRLLPLRLATPAAAAFVAAELVLAAGLLLPATAPWAAVGAAGLLTLYSGAIAVNLLRGRRDIDCGCGGPLGRRRLSAALVVRNALLIAAAGAITLPTAARPLGALDAFTMAGALASAALLYLASEALFARRLAP